MEILSLFLKLYFTVACLDVIALLFSKFIIRNERIEDIVVGVGIYIFIIGVIFTMFAVIFVIWG